MAAENEFGPNQACEPGRTAGALCLGIYFSGQVALGWDGRDLLLPPCKVKRRGLAAADARLNLARLAVLGAPVR